MSADHGDYALYSADAERAVLGSMLAQPNEVMDEVAGHLLQDDFFVPAHQEIFRACGEMHGRRMAIEPMTVHQWLTDRKMAESVGSPGILAELMAGYATHLNVTSYVRIVKEKAMLRKLQQVCSATVQMIADAPDDPQMVLDQAEQALGAISIQQVSQDSEPMSKMATSAIQRILSYDARSGITGIPSGLRNLDELTGGWQAGEMIVLAARPGQGKSALGVLFGLNAAERGKQTDFVSLEMSREQLEDRILALKTLIPLYTLKRGLTEPGQHTVLQEWEPMLAALPFSIYAPPHLTGMQLRAHARRRKRKYGLDLLIVDYLQLMHSGSKKDKENRQVEVAEISRQVKSLALELQIPIVVLAQLNRKSDETSREPGLHNLRESGAIEQDADVVMLLHRETEDASLPILEYKLIIAKQRNGPTDALKLHFKGAYTLFQEPLAMERHREAT